MQQTLSPINSTMSDFIDSVSNAEGERQQPKPWLLTLINLICNDMHHVLRYISSALDSLELEIEAELPFEQKLYEWQRFLGRVDREIRRSSESLAEFLAFLQAHASMLRTTKSDLVQISTLTGGCHRDIVRLQARRADTSRSVAAYLSLLESKRSLGETESVTKLTEIAFFFLPLTFSASIFSMQVKELAMSDVSISVFIGLSAGLIALLYAVRLLIRSGPVKSVREHALHSIRTYGDLRSDAPVPTRMFLIGIAHFLLQRLKDRVHFSAVGAVIGIVLLLQLPNVAVVSSLWVREIDSSLKAVITGLVVLASIGWQVIWQNFFRRSR